MKISKHSEFNPVLVKENVSEHLKKVDQDLQNIITFSQGRVRYGTSADGYRGQNISGEFHTVANTGTADTEFSFSHNLKIVPTDYHITSINKGGTVYKSSTPWTTSTVYFKCSTANTAVTIFLLK